MKEEGSSPQSFAEDSLQPNEPEDMSKLESQIKKAELEIHDMDQKYQQKASCLSLKKSGSGFSANINKFQERSKTPIYEASLVSTEIKPKLARFNIGGISYRKSTQDENSEKRRQNFKETVKSFYIQKPKFTEESDSRLRQTDPLIFLEITMAPGIEIKLPVTKMDTPSFLAEKCFHLANIETSKENKEIVQRLTKIIQEKVNEAIKKIADAVKEKKLREKQEEQEKEKKLRDISISKEYNLYTEKRKYQRNAKGKVLGKVVILIEKKKPIDIIVREGDDAEQVVENFLISFKLGHEHYDAILAEVNRLIQNSKKSQSFIEESKQGISPTTGSTQKVPKKLDFTKNKFKTPEKNSDVLFTVHFNAEDGGQIELEVKKNDNLYKVAHNFVTSHNMPIENIQSLWEILKELNKVFFI